MWTIDLFVKDNGRCPTQDFLDELSPSADRPYIRKRFGQFRFFYFFFVEQTIIITHGRKKKDFSTADIDLAKEYRHIYFSRYGMKP